MTDSPELDSALFQRLFGCHPDDLFNKLFQNMAGTMNDAVTALQSSLLEEYKEESDRCDEIKKCCHAMRQDLVHKKSKYFAEQLSEYYSRNILCIPRHTSISAVDSNYVEVGEQQHDPTSCSDIPLLLGIVEKLVKNIEVIDKAIQERRVLLEQVKEVKKRCDMLSQNAQTGNDLLKDENIQKSLTSDLQ